jgi:hypothetical protein
VITLELTFTYDVITPESAEHGDAAEYGFYAPGGWKYPIGGSECPEPMSLEDATPEPTVARARDVLRDIRDTCGCVEVEAYGGRLSAYACDPSIDWRTGEDTRIAAHVTGHPRLIAALAKALRK